jgi:hypothetical protein
MALALLVGAALVIILFATVGSAGRHAGPAVPIRGSTGAPAVHAPARRGQVPGPTSPRAPATALPAHSAPVAVAASFTQAFLGAGQAGSHVWGSLTTPALAANLTTSPGAPAGDAQVQTLGARRVQAISTAIDDQAPGAVGVSTVATVQFGSGEHASVLTEYLDLLVVSTPSGWKVSRVDL